MQIEKGRRFVVPVALLVVVLLLVSGAGFTGYQLGTHNAGGAVTVSGDRPSLATFWEAWNTLDKRFYGDTSSEKRMEGAISGMVAGLGDPYTTYLAPKQDDLFRSGLEGSFGGIGAELEVISELLTVVTPLQGTPAEKAGLLAGDIIIKIDGTETKTLSFLDAIDKIRGEKGTNVTLTVVRTGKDEAIDIVVTRDTITVKSVSSQNIGTNDEIAYIKLNQFGADTSKLFGEALQKAVDDKKKGVVVDLRNNPGGFLDSAITTIGFVLPEEITSDNEFLKARTAVRETYKNKPDSRQVATNAPIAPTIPMVVLVNGGSASASEIFSGAMKDYGRATLIGQKTFGKGSVQDLVDLENGGSIKVTIAHWLTPLGTEINKKGVLPDKEVTLAEGEKISAQDSQVAAALAQLGSAPAK
ncbi:S41 family peptidase [soil metagenome]